tara:strand:- start:335 stop:580 length:246 start_codon:yes stop_codon:yes gene_type:complete
MIIKYFAWIRDITSVNEENLNDSSIIDVNSLKKFISTKYPKLKKHIDEDIIRISINLNYSYENDKISQSDEIALFPPVSGG